MFIIFFFNEHLISDNYPTSLHDALPIWTRRFRPTIDEPNGLQVGIIAGRKRCLHRLFAKLLFRPVAPLWSRDLIDRKSTRLNSSHLVISYAVFCLEKIKVHYLSGEVYYF